MSELTRSVVYFIETDDSRAIKVGTSTDVKRRIQTLQTACPYPLRLILSIPGGRVEEGAVHGRFHRERLHGEWFPGDGALRGFVIDLLGMTEERRVAAIAPPPAQVLTADELASIHSDWRDLESACFAVIMDVGIISTAEQLSRYGRPGDRPLLPSTIQNVLDGKGCLRADWIPWFTQRSEMVWECMYRMTSPKAREYVALCRGLRDEIGVEAANELIARARAA